MRSGSLGMLLAFLALAGCGRSGERQDLQQFMNEVRSRPSGVIEPLPRFQAPEPFSYSAAALRSPFVPQVRLVAQSGRKQRPKPNQNRVKGPLESFDIESFKMVGTLGEGGNAVGLLKRPDQVYSVRVGDYLGLNDGRITAINDQEVDVVEVVPDGAGGWVERPRAITLKESSGT